MKWWWSTVKSFVNSCSMWLIIHKSRRSGKGSFSYYVRKIFRKTHISRAQIHTHSCAYQGMWHNSFSEIFCGRAQWMIQRMIIAPFQFCFFFCPLLFGRGLGLTLTVNSNVFLFVCFNISLVDGKYIITKMENPTDLY